MTRYRSLVQTYWCDSVTTETGSCRESFEAEGQVSDVWTSAYRAGWRVAALNGREVHYCPNHAERA